jgi:hypothetical protein
MPGLRTVSIQDLRQFDFETPSPAFNGETQFRPRLRGSALRLRRLSIFSFEMLYGPRRSIPFTGDHHGQKM